MSGRRTELQRAYDEFATRAGIRTGIPLENAVTPDRTTPLLSERAAFVPPADAVAAWLRWRHLLASYLKPLVYALYERRLLTQVQSRPPPRHVGIILDGNRRFGRLSGLVDPVQVYAPGAQKLDELLDWCGELSIPAVTLWVCSTDNLARQPQEVAGILGALEFKLLALVNDPQIHRRRVRVQAIGRLELLPESTVAAIRSAEAATAGYDAMLLSIAVAYGGREEIADAVREMLAQALKEGVPLAQVIDEICPERIGRHLYLADTPEPDLIIRTSGELRLSGFMLWQSAYSEFYFSDVLWPAFRKIDFLRAVRAFQQRRRRYGR
jgi:short-chain Z-isoprenyl diphosphate synthase